MLVAAITTPGQRGDRNSHAKARDRANFAAFNPGTVVATLVAMLAQPFSGTRMPWTRSVPLSAVLLALACGAVTEDGPQGNGAASPSAGAAGASGATSDSSSGAVPCTAEEPCPAGMQCVGSACDEPWHCESLSEPPDPNFSLDWCGCDGTLFTTGYPQRPWVHAGAQCAFEPTVDCDPRRAAPDCGPPPPCEQAGHVRAVGSDGCWERWCTAITACQCVSPEQCPEADKYTCLGGTRCGPYPE